MNFSIQKILRCAVFINSKYAPSTNLISKRLKNYRLLIINRDFHTANPLKIRKMLSLFAEHYF
jgi:hypothetical protein